MWNSLAPSDIPDIVDGTFRTLLRTGNNYMYPPDQLLAALMTIYNVQGGCRGYSDMLVRMDDLSLIVRDLLRTSHVMIHRATHSGSISRVRSYDHADGA
jgi:hypothetical protein